MNQVRSAQGELVRVTLYKRGAVEVVRRLQRNGRRGGRLRSR
jgi:hypothetical protein